MSKGEIVEHLGDGLYRVKLQYAVYRVKAEIAEMEGRLQKINTGIPDEQDNLSDAESAVDAKTGEIDQLIPQLTADASEVRDQITALQSELITLQSRVAIFRYQVERLKGERLAIRKRLQALRRIPEEEELEAWCADYSEELRGLVGIVDINDEGGQGIVIQPGFDGAAKYLPARDGTLMPRAAQSGAQVYFNAAILPGIQKWSPMYRAGTLLDIENDAGTVVLDDASSSEQRLDINQNEVLKNAPIKYMDCDSDVFESGDRVIVRFTQSGPLVVGFESEPKPCGLDVYILDADYGIVRMSPDMRTVKEVVKSGSERLRDFAITSKKLMVVYDRESTYQPPDYPDTTYNNSLVVFESSGATLETQYDEPSFEIRHVAGANSQNFLLELNQGGAETAYAESYTLEGEYVGRVNVTGQDLDIAAYNFHHLPANDEFVLYGNLSLLSGDFAVARVSLLSGSRSAYYDASGNWNTKAWATKNRVYISRIGPNRSFVEIYDMAGGYIGNWNLETRYNTGTFFVVTKRKAYAFSHEEFQSFSSPGFSEVAVYERDGDSFALSEVVDMRAEHGFDVIPKAMPDMKDLLSLDA